jgi:hypothetical protein
MKRTRTAWSIALLSLHNLQLILWSTIIALLPNQIFEASYRTFLGRSWSGLQQSDAALTTYVTAYARFWGIQGLLLGAILSVICYTAYRRAERWAWLLVLVCSTIGWASAIALDIYLKDAIIVVFDAIPLLLAYSSLIISWKDAFGPEKDLQTER